MPFRTGVRGQETVRLNLEFPGVVCTAEEDKARQEYKQSSEIGYQISRFGVGHPVAHGEFDYDNLDLTRAYELVNDASERWLRLPRVIRDRYHSWAAVEAAASSGELEQVLKTAGVPASSAGAAGVSASDSAAESTAESGSGR